LLKFPTLILICALCKQTIATASSSSSSSLQLHVEAGDVLGVLVEKSDNFSYFVYAVVYNAIRINRNRCSYSQRSADDDLKCEALFSSSESNVGLVKKSNVRDCTAEEDAKIVEVSFFFFFFVTRKQCVRLQSNSLFSIDVFISQFLAIPRRLSAMATVNSDKFLFVYFEDHTIYLFNRQIGTISKEILAQVIDVEVVLSSTQKRFPPVVSAGCAAESRYQVPFEKPRQGWDSRAIGYLFLVTTTIRFGFDHRRCNRQRVSRFS
jgi:hypothetical protein